VDWLVEDNVLEECAGMYVECVMVPACFSETLAFINQYTRQLNPKEHHLNHHRHGNFKSYGWKSYFQKLFVGET
jgi:hypothetical protein